MKKLAKITALSTLIVLCLCGTAFAGALPDTGQTKCYNDTAEIPCPAPGEDFYGQDAQYTTNPRSYTKLDAGGNDLPDSAASWTMVRDNVTGLIWEVKTDDGAVHDRDNTYTWHDSNPATNGGDRGAPGDGTDTEDFINALNAENFGGHSDWRLPNIKELASITNFGRYMPAIDQDYFTSKVSYWTSVTRLDQPFVAWCVNHSSGGHSDFSKAGHYHARAVRGIAFGTSNLLINNGNGTITDSQTGLRWQQNGSGVEMTWKDALAYCEGLSLTGYDDWRLPNSEEILSIADFGKHDPIIDTEYFPDTASSIYWSSTTFFGNNSYGSMFHFYHGQGGTHGKSNLHYVRCVRGGVIPQTHTLTTNTTPPPPHFWRNIPKSRQIRV